MSCAQLHRRVVLGFTVLLLLSAPLWAQTRPIVIQGGTLIDGTGRPAVSDSVVVINQGRFQEVGKRGELNVPQDAEVIDAKGKTILPGLIDGHCHYRDWMGEVYLALRCHDLSKYLQQSRRMDHSAARRRA